MNETHEKNLSELRQKRAEILDRVREKMPSEAAALDAISMALEIAVAANVPAGPYRNISRGIDAVVAHLRAAGKPMERGRLIAEVLAGGWREGDPHAYAKLWDVIRYHCDDAKTLVIVRRPGDTVALAKGSGK